MPNAKHYAPEAEIAQCLNPDRIRKASYRSQDLQTLLDEDLPLGSHTVGWDGRDDQGQPVSSGTYLYRLRSGEVVQERKMDRKYPVPVSVAGMQMANKSHHPPNKPKTTALCVSPPHWNIPYHNTTQYFPWRRTVQEQTGRA